MLIDPMGRVVTELDEAQGEFLAEIDAAPGPSSSPRRERPALVRLDNGGWGRGQAALSASALSSLAPVGSSPVSSRSTSLGW
jgi:hypothetical protein